MALSRAHTRPGLGVPHPILGVLLGVATMRPPAPGTDHGLVTSESVHLAIAVDFDGDEISGHASDGLAAPTPFSGWLD